MSAFVMGKTGYIIALVMAVLGTLTAILFMFKRPFFIKGPGYPLSKRVVSMAAPVFLGLLGLRLFAVEAGASLSWALPDSVLMAMRTFLVDGDIHVKELFDCVYSRLELIGLTGGAQRCFAIALKSCEWLLDIGAPLLTLTAVLEVLSSLFPKLRIKFHFKCEKFVFSEVNEETVTLAESIYSYRQEHPEEGPMPMFIITDVYTEGEDERTCELMDRLRAIGALCLKDDMLLLDIRSSKKVTYILLDEDRMGNLSDALTLADRLASDPKLLRRDNSVYFFCDLEQAEELVSKKSLAISRTMLRAMAEEEKRAPKSASRTTVKDPDTGEKVTVLEDSRYKAPFLVPMKEYKNTVYGLIHDTPLFTPIIGRDKKDLNVVILGSGNIGTEAFLACYWAGQMLGRRLNLTVISREAATGLRQRLSKISSEILESADPKKYKRPYCTLTLIGCDLDNVSMEELFALDIKDTGGQVIKQNGLRIFAVGQDIPRLCLGDYFITALGSDQRNISISYSLRYALERAAIKGQRDCPDGLGPVKAVVAMGVYDPSLVGSAGYDDPKDQLVTMIPFASLEERYSYENVINKRFKSQAISSAVIYENRSSGGKYTSKDMKEIFGDGVNKPYSHYKYSSNIARAVHLKTMLFSAGITADTPPQQAADKLRDDRICDELAWLEHRRWCAFLRTMGYVYADVEKDFVARKVQPCLVEIEPGRHHHLPFTACKQSLQRARVDGEIKAAEGKVPLRNPYVPPKGEREGQYCSLTYDEIMKAPYDALDQTVYRHFYDLDTRVYDYPQSSGLTFSDEFMKQYLQPGARTYLDSKTNGDEYTFELYARNKDGTWNIERILLDDRLKGLVYSKEYRAPEKVVDLMLSLNRTYRDDAMTREQALELLGFKVPKQANETEE